MGAAEYVYVFGIHSGKSLHDAESGFEPRHEMFQYSHYPTPMVVLDESIGVEDAVVS